MAAPDNVSQARERVTVLRAQQGDREAFSRLCDLYDQRLLYFVRRLLGESEGALDVLQSVWLTVHRKLGTLKSPDSFRVWLYRIAHDRAITELRKSRNNVRAFDGIESEPVSDTAQIHEKAFENAELVHLGLQGLSVHHRQVLTLHFLECMTVEEIAQVIDSNPGTVKSRLYYAKAALRERIEGLNRE